MASRASPPGATVSVVPNAPLLAAVGGRGRNAGAAVAWGEGEGRRRRGLRALGRRSSEVHQAVCFRAEDGVMVRARRMAGVEALDRSNYCSQRRGRRRGLSVQGGDVQAEDSDSALPPHSFSYLSSHWHFSLLKKIHGDQQHTVGEDMRRWLLNLFRHTYKIPKKIVKKYTVLLGLQNMISFDLLDWENSQK
jgi:hypothetical protein